jgi:hypothetical protein
MPSPLHKIPATESVALNSPDLRFLPDQEDCPNAVPIFAGAGAIKAELPGASPIERTFNQYQGSYQ